MVDILSLPQRSRFSAPWMRRIVIKHGLPLNSLPGWEDIPLNCKLPMLSCPGNTVIFSKNKIGHMLKLRKHEFLTHGATERIPEYNSLNDVHLKEFYKIERNLKRLRQNGEITENNDVICSLKEFNEHREQLHQILLYFFLRDQNFHAKEQAKMRKIEHSEQVFQNERNSFYTRWTALKAIRARREAMEEYKRTRYHVIWNKTLMKFQAIAKRKALERKLIQHQKLLHSLNIAHHQSVHEDLQRRRNIRLKKIQASKWDRYEKYLMTRAHEHNQEQQRRAVEAWKIRLNKRIEHQERIKRLLQMHEERQRMNVEKHIQLYKTKWEKTREAIKARAQALKASKRNKKKAEPRPEADASPPPEEIQPRHSVVSTYRDIYENMFGPDLAEAMNTVVDMVGNLELFIDFNDPIYKAAKYIKQKIIDTFSTDLSRDVNACKCLCLMVSEIFVQTQEFVQMRATKVISATRDGDEKDRRQTQERMVQEELAMLTKRGVSFETCSQNIGKSSYQVDPSIMLKKVCDRPPTPAGSLASLFLEEKGMNPKSKIDLSHLKRDELVYMEHMVIRFKRELLVGIGRRVFLAIQAHSEGKIFNVSRDLLDVDRDYLISNMTMAILRSAIDPTNFKAAITFSINVLAGEIIWNLQEYLMPVERDPRGIVPTYICCPHRQKFDPLCLFCE